jgi:Domain of unknown function (DUF1707)
VVASHVRVSDEQRDAAAGLLREHFAAGRLTEEELSERVQAAVQARTTGDLDRLLADLPRLPATPAQQRAGLVERRRQLHRQLIQQTGGSLGVFVLCTVIWLLSGANGQFWPVWVAIFPALALIRNGWRLYGPAPELERVERELARRRSTPPDRKERRELRRGEGRGRH